MEVLRREVRRWWAAFFAAARYVALMQLISIDQWLEIVTPHWSDLTELDMKKFWVKQALTALTTIGAVMNDKWSRARNAYPPPIPNQHK